VTIASPRWDYYAADLRTGQILMDLPLVGFSGEVNLLGNGPMDAGLPLAHLGDTQRRDLLDATIPGRRTVVGVRDGTVRGEWIIWSRSRRNNTDPVQLSGAEVLTYANRRIVQAWSWTQTEQLQIADNLLTTAFRGSDWPPGGGAVALTVAPWTASGQKRDRTYKAIDGTIGARLRELSEVDNGFDYVLTPTWSGGGSSALIVRTAQLSYPQAGGDFGMIMEMAGTGFQTPGGGGGNILDFRDEEDTTELASRTYAVGETTDDVTLTGVYHDQALTDAGYPFMERSASYSTVKEQPTIDDYARALWIDAQSPASVVEIVALADVSPAIGEYSLGDIVTLILDPSINYPDGYQGQVRVLGWKFAPPSSGPATVTIKITRELSV
jgi:hypothetical protein